MDNNAPSDCMSEEEDAVKLHESTEQKINSLNFLQEKSEQEENGHVTLSTCAEGGGGDTLECIDIILPGLETAIQQEEENGNTMVTEYENSKHNIYQYNDENHQNDGDELSNKFVKPEMSDNKIEELENIQVINVTVIQEEETNDQVQELELQENQVMVQSIETLNFDETNLVNEYSDDNVNSHIDEEEENENENENKRKQEIEETILEDDYEIEEHLQDNDEISEEYIPEKMSVNTNDYDNETIHKETIAGEESYVADNDDEIKKTESLEHSNSECEMSDEYTHLTNPPEIQLSNKTPVLIDEKHHFTSSTQATTYEVYSSDSEGTTIKTHNKEHDKLHLITAGYRQKNIINIAAVSANIDIQDDEPSEIIEDQQESKQTNDNEEHFSSIQENVNIENRESELGSDELVDNRHDEQIIMIQKEGGIEEEGASEVIEEIYFIQDVSGSSDNNFEQNKNSNNSNEEIQQNDNQGDIDDEQEEEESKNYFSKTSENSVVKNSSKIVVEKSRNVIQDIFDDWGDENADEDNQIFPTKIQDTVEIELNNLLNNDNIKKKPVIISTEIIQTENANHENDDDDDYDNSTVILNNDQTSIKNSQEETRITSNIVTTSSTASIPSSSSSTSLPVKKNTKNSTPGKDDIPSYVQPYVRGTYSSSAELSTSSLHPDQDVGYEESTSKRKLQSPRLGVKVPSRHLKSQIATPAEVTEVLKERLREKQKNLETPQAADMVFVKKLTQRFASKICPGGTMPVPGLIPIQPSRDSLDREGSSSVVNDTPTTINSNDNPDNRELLAILEGDVDPDWSKPQSLTRSATSDTVSETDDNNDTSADKNYSRSYNSSENSTLSKLSSTARELALKQLLELPSATNKKIKKKKLKINSNKQAVDQEEIEKSSLKVQKEESEEKEKLKSKSVNLIKKKLETIKQKNSSSSTLSSSPSSLIKTKRTSLSPAQKSLKENDSQNTPLKATTTTSDVEIPRIDETRSGRKRKPTEKALEQYASKRQKMYKTNSPQKIDSEVKAEKNALNQIVSATVASPTKKKKSISEESPISNEDSISTNIQKGSKEDSNKKSTDINLTSSKSPLTKKIDKNVKTPNLVKKEKNNFSSPTTSLEETRTRKSTTTTTSFTRRFLSPRLLKAAHKTKKLVNVQNKISSPTAAAMSPTAMSLHKRPVGRPAKVNVNLNSPKRLLVKERLSFKKTETTTPKRKRKTGIKEIDRLLQDEGVVNLLYDVGQPRKKRLIPITKSQKKVMDIEKAERDLDLRKKLVKSTVLGFRDSDTKLDKIAFRTKRRTSPPNDIPNNNRHHHAEESSSSSSSSSSVTTDKRKNSTEMTTEFIYPAKIRNAADASVIVRRHSSSSFSSVSGSPRVSIDSPLETGSSGGQQQSDENNHGLRSTTKRKQSSSDRGDIKHNILEAKRNKQSKVPENSTNIPLLPSNKSPKSSKIHDTQPSSSTIVAEDEDTRIGSIKKNKVADIDERNNKKIIKNQTLNQDSRDDNTVNNLEKTDKVTTRSNVNNAALKKTFPPNSQNKKRMVKEKSSSLTSNNNNNNNNNKGVDATEEESSKNQDKLSACLAEAATALSSVTSGTNTINCDVNSSTDSSEIGHCRGSTGRKNKVLTNDVKKQSDKSNSSNNNSSSSNNPTHGDTSLSSSLFIDNKEINVCRYGNLVQLILSPSSAKIMNGITLKVMQELCDTLSILKTDEECRVVLFTSNGGTSFCEGLDLSTLLHTNKEKRKLYAEEMANAVKEFIKCLATFNKPLVAGVQGAAVGLGVTILPLFDLVIASDKATFYTPYGKLGQIPEGAAIMTLSHVHGSAVASELLLGGRTLTASEALRAGLVTRVLWPERFPLELLPSVKAMSEQSSQSMEATKALLRQSLRNKLNAALESETHILVKQWCSDECQIAIKKYTTKQIE